MSPEFDKEGFLVNLETWTETVAETIAFNEEIDLTSEHWEIISIVRQFYQDYELSPVNRTLIKAVKQKLGDEKGNSIYLMSLFSGSPAKLAAKIAGLPKPNNCL